MSELAEPARQPAQAPDGLLARAPLCLLVAGLAIAPLGEGGRAPTALLVSHSLIAMAWLVVIRLDGARVLLRDRILWLAVSGFGLFAMTLTPYRYSTALVLADIAVAASIFALARWCLARDRRGARPLAIALGCAVALQAAVLLADKYAPGLIPRGLLGGFVPNANHAAGFVALGGAAAAGAGVAGGLRRLRALVGFAAAAAALAIVVLVASRGAFVACGAGVVAACLGRGRRALLLAPLFAAGCVLFGPTGLGERIRSGGHGDPYFWERPKIWQAAGRMAFDHALSGGVGLGLFSRAAHRYNFPVEHAAVRYGKYPNSAHNDYLELAAEASLPGLLLLALPAGIVAWELVRLARGQEHSATRWGAAAGLSAVAVHALADSVLQVPAVLNSSAILMAWLLPGTACGGERRAPARGRLACGAAVVALWVAGVWSPWRGERLFRRALAAEAPSVRLEGMRDALRREPGHAGYRARYAEELWTTSSEARPLAGLAEALRELRYAVELDPVASDIRRRQVVLLHQAFLRLGRPRELLAEARLAYVAARESDPFNPLILVGAAHLELDASSPERALPLLARALELEPRYLGARSLRAQVASDLGDLELAARERATLARDAAEADRSRRPASSYEAFVLAPPRDTGSGHGSDLPLAGPDPTQSGSGAAGAR